ncbi:MAG: hypothetical protein ABIZ56_05655 [Chthoniobacteraceae bacterium]
MDFVPRRCIAAVFILALSIPASAQKARTPAEQESIEHAREELGINEFTAPSIEQVFRELEELRPIPFDKVWRDLPDTQPQNRALLGLLAGGVIADGFLAVAAEKMSRIEPVGRTLLRLAKGLGVGDHITKHSRSILEKSVQNHWPDVKKELVRAQADTEAGLLALKDEEIAHLVALGGWLRGLEITSSLVAEDYSEKRAGRLIQPELFDYFIDRVGTLSPKLKAMRPFQIIDRDLKQIHAMTTRPVDTPMSLEDVKQVRNLAREMNKAIVKGDEQ